VFQAKQDQGTANCEQRNCLAARHYDRLTIRQTDNTTDWLAGMTMQTDAKCSATASACEQALLQIQGSFTQLHIQNLHISINLQQVFVGQVCM